MYINKSICAQCGGTCCKTNPCLLSIRDCNGDVESKLKQLKSEQSVTVYAFSTQYFLLWIGTRYFEEFDSQFTEEGLVKVLSIFKKLRKYEEVYVVRMRSVNSEEVEFVKSERDIEHFIAAGTCVKLLSSGCEYSDDERPYGGLSMIPDEQGRGMQFCQKTYTLLKHANEWYKYHSIIQELFFNTHKGGDT